MEPRNETPLVSRRRLLKAGGLGLGAAALGLSPIGRLLAQAGAPGATHPGAKGVIEEHLDAQGLKRHVSVRVAHFSLIPAMVASTLLVLTTGRAYCQRFVGQLPVRILECPIPFPRMRYYQLWHERSHGSAAGKWLREQGKAVAAGLSDDSPAG